MGFQFARFSLRITTIRSFYLQLVVCAALHVCRLRESWTICAPCSAPAHVCLFVSALAWVCVCVCHPFRFPKLLYSNPNALWQICFSRFGCPISDFHHIRNFINIAVAGACVPLALYDDIIRPIFITTTSYTWFRAAAGAGMGAALCGSQITPIFGLLRVRVRVCVSLRWLCARSIVQLRHYFFEPDWFGEMLGTIFFYSEAP